MNRHRPAAPAAATPATGWSRYGATPVDAAAHLVTIPLHTFPVIDADRHSRQAAVIDLVRALDETPIGAITAARLAGIGLRAATTRAGAIACAQSDAVLAGMLWHGVRQAEGGGPTQFTAVHLDAVNEQGPGEPGMELHGIAFFGMRNATGDRADTGVRIAQALSPRGRAWLADLVLADPDPDIPARWPTLAGCGG